MREDQRSKNKVLNNAPNDSPKVQELKKMSQLKEMGHNYFSKHYT